jgi:hypothetical protein
VTDLPAAETLAGTYHLAVCPSCDCANPCADAADARHWIAAEHAGHGATVRGLRVVRTGDGYTVSELRSGGVAEVGEGGQ